MKKKKISSSQSTKKVVTDSSQKKISSFFGRSNNVNTNQVESSGSTTAALFPSTHLPYRRQETSPDKHELPDTQAPVLQPKSPNVLSSPNSSLLLTLDNSDLIPPTPKFAKKSTSVTYIPPTPESRLDFNDSASSPTCIPPTQQVGSGNVFTKIKKSLPSSPSSLSSYYVSQTPTKSQSSTLPRCKRSLMVSEATGFSPDKKKPAISKIEETVILEDSFDNLIAEMGLSSCISKALSFNEVVDAPSSGAKSASSFAEYLELGRHVVERVECVDNREIILHLEGNRICRLRDMWLHSVVRAGDVVNIQGSWEHHECIVDHKQGLVVIQPDILISGTSVVASIFCMRKAVLAERIKGSQSSKAMLLGSLVHEMLQKSIQKPEQPGYTVALVDELLRQSPTLQQLLALGVAAEEMRQNLLHYVPQIRYVIDKYVLGRNVDVPALVPCTQQQGRKPAQRVEWPGKICEIRDVEENVWSPRLGIKGKIDLTVEVAIHNRTRKIVPLELKTGKSTFSAEHRGQLTLYSMMLAERHPDPGGGLLLYLKDCAMNDVPAGTKEKSQLVQLRNEMVLSMLAPPSQRDGVLMEAPLPPPIDRLKACENCDFLTVCSIYQQADSSVPEPPHDMATLVPRALAHLTSGHIHFYTHWSLLMRLENMELLKKSKTKDLWSQVPQEREKAGRCLTDCRINKTVPMGDFWEVTFVRPRAPFPSAGIQTGETVIISCQKWIAIATGHVSRLNATSLVIATDKSLKLYKGETFFIDRMEYQSGVAGLMGNLATLMDDTPRATKLRELIIDKTPPSFAKGLTKRLTTDGKPVLAALNVNQQRALLTAIASEDYCLIHGMPGTGKTQVIVALIRLAVMLGQSVMITSSTHSAVDNVLLRLRPYDLPMLRLGQDQRIHPTLRPFCEKAVLGSCTNLEELERVYSSKLVVGTTCLGSGHALLQPRTFSMCIVDEAAQTLLLSTLGPLFKAHKFVLVGDPLQLPPVVQSTRAKSLGLEKSLFAHLAEEATEKALLPLQLQYRMCGPIMDVANALVYQGKLQAGSEQVRNARLAIIQTQVFAQFPAWLKNVLEPEQPVVWVDTSQIEARETQLLKQAGVVNEFEQNLVAYLVQSLTKVGVSVDTIGVIAPYQSQVQAIRRKLESLWPALEVNTVDQYQGRDKDVLMYSCTRSRTLSDTTSMNNTRGEILEDLRRLTVAVTRAKVKLIILGNSDTLQAYAPFAKLLNILKCNQMCKLNSGYDDFKECKVTVWDEL